MSPLGTNYFSRSLHKLNLSFKVSSAKDPSQAPHLSCLTNFQSFRYCQLNTPNTRKQICRCQIYVEEEDLHLSSLS
uniref:Putative ovule protein n=1 Tax=Solanum chacoense TaxID=4108 RepID=A0A0V0IWC9_SOLCH